MLDAEKQLELRNKALKELERLDAIEEDTELTSKINEFSNKFQKCEIVYKVILKVHQEDNGKKNTNRLKIDMRQVPYALDYAGYQFDKDLLNKLFGAEEHRNMRSVKKIRDGLTHSRNKSILEELENRYIELNGYMDEFLEIIRNYDEEK